jgi:hypothetical protein
MTCADISGNYLQYCDHFPVCMRNGINSCVFDYCTAPTFYFGMEPVTADDCASLTYDTLVLATDALGLVPPPANVSCKLAYYSGTKACTDATRVNIDQCFDLTTSAALTVCPAPCTPYTMYVPELGLKGYACWNVSTTTGVFL